ncbi:MAG TPA: SPOR domain-containing protein [bacterium]|uniref:Rare lipoprotein A n=1 Tax=candidate division TA06 bacterium ADurb.Bin417 TaxID=1852828 RepID=A0A1V5MDK5_UNCT6|nr:MAG: rare lipoprotein A [candidate division TA06 bacterium ADurb.Bin417]HNQ34921.1 SPOR domain-containing protein [bacterium]HNS48173.1 SPOR domain-containing protein [bacterium]
MNLNRVILLWIAALAVGWLAPGRSGGQPVSGLEDLVLREEYRAAIQTYGEIPDLTPMQKYLLAVCYQETRDVKKAEEIWKNLLGSRERERSLLAIARLKGRTGPTLESEQTFRQFLREYPLSTHLPTACLGLAEVLVKRGKKTEALTLLNRIRQEYPFSPEAVAAGGLLNRELGEYTIQVGSFSDYLRAQKLVDDLAADGYDAYLVRIPDQAALSYRVRVGNFSSRAAADRIGRTLKQANRLEYFITH